MIRLSNDGRVYVGSVDLYKAIRDLETPLYIYDLDEIERRYLYLKELGERLTKTVGVELVILYALKANSNPDIITLLRDLGSGFDAASPGEALWAKRLGVDPGRIYLTAPGLSKRDLEIAIREKININIDSMNQLKYLIELGFSGEIGVRINPGFGEGFHRYAVTGGEYSKFGVELSRVGEIIDLAKKSGIRIKRIHAHIGSGVMDPEKHVAVLKKLLEISREYDETREIDIGGGFGISYETDDEYPFEKLFERIFEVLSSESKKIERLFIEPGRYLVARSGLLVARVTDIKEFRDKTIILVDTGFNHLIRPVLYGAKHRVVVLNKSSRERISADIYGNLCESSDYLARDITLPRVEIGDTVVFLDAGAYGYSMASMYNLRPLPAEYVVKRGSIKKSRDSFLPTMPLA